MAIGKFSQSSAALPPYVRKDLPPPTHSSCFQGEEDGQGGQCGWA
jgi:hypothetical protein